MPGVKVRPERTPAGGRNSVRIVGGAWRGRRVHFPNSPGLRPTPDRVRETLFNWLQQTIGEARCLDLFAGSGALGFEALSRGAREVVFVDQAAAVVQTLRGELERLGGGRAVIVQAPAARFLGETGQPFDGVFVDPPFGQAALAQYVAQLAAGNWVKPGGWVYLESERAAGAPQMPPGWELLKSKSAGEVGYHLARVSPQNGQ
jgi:16S rRNA (guanine966-N2)-methyltransferase